VLRVFVAAVMLLHSRCIATIVFFKFPIYLQSVRIHSANGGKGEGCLAEECSVAHASFVIPFYWQSANCVKHVYSGM
jgi:hypothetical protein